MNDEKHILILYSGGLDSYCMQEMAKKEKHKGKLTGDTVKITKLYIDYGNEVSKAEIPLLPDDVIVTKLDWFGQDDTVKRVAKVGETFGASFIPGRNLVFSVLAACMYLPDEIWLGSLVDEVNEKATDKNDKFKEDTSKLLSYVLQFWSSEIKLKFPLAESGFNKVGVVQYLLDNGHTLDEIATRSTSCWDSTDPEKGCGVCKQCVKKFITFYNFMDGDRPYILNNLRENPLHNKEVIEELARAVEKLNEIGWNHYSANDIDWNTLIKYWKDRALTSENISFITTSVKYWEHLV